jgi:YebC/PmpR family DNA-binding regulatory protein
MSGHSKWATTHRQKEVKDAARGKLFSKLASAISIAVKTGGGPNPDSNFKLRVVIEKAREANMPKENIERAISKGIGSGSLDEVTYEGFGPYGIAVIIEAATDNRNRTSAEIKNILERAGGSLAGPGAVAFNFTPSGFILVDPKEGESADDTLLKLIDLGVNDLEVTEDGIEVYVAPSQLYEEKGKIESAGYKTSAAELIMRPKNMVKIEDSAKEKTLSFLDTLEEHDDVQKVFTNADI